MKNSEQRVKMREKSKKIKKLNPPDREESSTRYEKSVNKTKRTHHINSTRTPQPLLIRIKTLETERYGAL